MRRRPHTRVAAIAATGLLAAVLTACSQAAPQVQPPPKPAEPPPVVQNVQIERILKELSAELEQAQSESDPAALTGRVGGAALTMIQAHYAAKAANPEEQPLDLGTGFADGQIVARSALWPRSFVVVTDSEPTEAPYIYQIGQADARSPYKMVLWAKMLAGATVPPAAAAGVGSDVVEPGSDDRTEFSPIAAVQAYVAAKDDPSGEAAALLDTTVQDGRDPDPARERWSAWVKGWRDNAATLAGSSVSAASALVEGSVSALATADSGALVFAQVKSVLDFSFTPVEGAYVNLVGSQGYLGLGASTLQAHKSAHIEHLQSVVLAVPPKGADQPIKVIAVADLPTAVQVE
ncbi:MAG: hypothetical protein LBS27_08415 [Bifidobacteriaceae bacterium]|jgi:hypothetical protein|nr:hypothetical protein [Bifidobacteriaceae bacterium]